jgi:uncharacterized protein (TIGR03083 family)
VKDCISHVTGTERMIMGDPLPQVAIDHLVHVNNPFGEIVELWVEERRPWSPQRVLAEYDEQVVRRTAEMRALDDEALDELTESPLGLMSTREFLKVRVFDCWMHEQDIRRAIDRPGHVDGPIIDVALERFQGALGYVVGKKAGAPDGATVVFAFDDRPDGAIAVQVDGRARVVDEVPDDPTTRLTMSFATFVARGGGRSTADEALAEGVVFDGDEELGRRVLEALAFTP